MDKVKSKIKKNMKVKNVVRNSKEECDKLMILFKKMLFKNLFDKSKSKDKVIKKKEKKEKSVKDKVVKKSVKVDKKKVKSVNKKKMLGGDNFAKDLQKSGKGLALAMEHTFQSMSNLGKDLYCETDAIMNIGNELDLGYSKECPFTKTKSWDYNKIKQ